MDANPWNGPDSLLSQFISNDFQQRLTAYRAKPDDITEHARIEAQVNEGGYAERQLLELVQNARDALYRAPGDGRITVILTNDFLYCANEGEPFTESGIRALLQSHMSPKRDDEIGRFGLGFKSVLGISTSIDVFSRTGSIGFDVTECHDAIKRRIPEYVGPMPGLRIGFLRDVFSARRNDPLLDELAQWATTIVRLATDGPHAPRLAHDLDSLPEEFVLFSPRVRPLEIHNHRAGTTRTLRADQLGDGSWRIDSGAGRHADWRINRSIHQVSDTGRSDAGEAVGRGHVELAWAAPLKPSRSHGAYWAYFPTRVTGSFGGIANATWKTNPDRQGLLDGAYNQELLNAFASLVLQSLGDLSTEDDPGRHLDHLPAEPSTGDSWWNRSLFDAILSAGPALHLVPDATGALRLGKELKLVPAQVTDEMLDAWETLGTDRSGWVHRTCHSRVRRSRAGRLGATEPTIQAWLQEVACPATAASVEVVFKIASALMAVPLFQAFVRDSAFVFIRGRKFHKPDPRTLFLDDEGVNEDPLLSIVDPLISNNEEARTILVRSFGIKNLDSTEVLKAHMARLPSHTAGDHERTWRLVRASGNNEALVLLAKSRTHMRVRCIDGEWRHPWQVMLPDDGEWHPGEVPDSAAVDRDFHKLDLHLLRTIGVVGSPEPHGFEIESSYSSHTHSLYSLLVRDYLQWGADEYRRLENKQSYSPFININTSAGPLSVIDSLSGSARMRYVTRLFELAASEPNQSWRNAANDRAPTHQLLSPAQWAFKYGKLEVPTTLGLFHIDQCADFRLNRWQDVMPIAGEAQFMQLPATLDRVSPEIVTAAYERCLTLRDARAAGAFYAAACGAGHAPPVEVLAQSGAISVTVSTGDGLLAHERGLAARAGTNVPLVLVPRTDDVQRMMFEWGMAASTVSAPCQWFGECPVESASDRFTGLPHGLATLLSGVMVVRCQSICREGDSESGLQLTPVEWHWDGGSRTFRHVEKLHDETVLRLLLEEAGADPESIELGIGAARQVGDERRAAGLRAIASDESRFAAMLPASAIRSRLPAGVVARVPSDTFSLARAAFALHGSAVLAEYKTELREAGFHAPLRWGQSETALAFVHLYGFDDAYAGEHRTERSPFVDVDGPIILGDLHTYQQDIRQRILEHIAATPARRALLSMPTGAGKTRVVVEALVDAMIDRNLNGHVIWVAHREELCEQAVQAWRDIWRWRGASRTLRISREWGGLEGARAPGSPDHRVIVATVQTLQKRVESPYLTETWAKGASCIVFDEAHASTTTSYTTVLSELGLFRGRTPIPLIGLSATPFRGIDESSDGQTAQLVRRYDSSRLDDGVFPENDAYPQLRRNGILSEADFEVIDGITVEPDEMDMKYFRNFRDFSDRMLQALSDNRERTSRIVERIAAIDPAWPTLVFAPSVANAQVLAGLLAIRGITARAISSETDRAARRDAIARFRDGTVRVLTNYGVLTTGFDAPKTRAIVVARPIFSPGLYMQVIGRGLRGPKNGGTDRCLIVNVDDNADRFGEQLAFRDLEYLWGM